MRLALLPRSRVPIFLFSGLALALFIAYTPMGSPLRRLSIAFKPSKSAIAPVRAASSDNVLTKYLAESKQEYLNALKDSPERAKEYVLVMGNEAGDLDSIASSITYAWLQNKSRPSVPFIQIRRDDLVLRPENIYALSLAGITNPRDQLLLIDDLASFSPFPATKFALVDHNRLGPGFVSENASVEAIVDHHEDERQHLLANPRIIAPAGSCASHVTLLCPDILPSEVATLLLSAILVDTNGVKPGGKAIQVDLDAVARLLPHTSLQSSQIQGLGFHDIPSLKALNEILAEKKANVSDLSPRDLLRRDYKEYTHTLHWHPDKPTITAGLSTVPIRLKDWGSRGNLVTEGQKYMKERGLAVLGVLTTFHDKKAKSKGKGKHLREMAWLVMSDTGVDERLWKGLESDEELDVVIHDTFKAKPAGDVKVRVYKQGNANATRKATAPLMKKILESPS